jgi:hypothetical protein
MVKQPGLRKRSGLDGKEIWSKALDTREGEVADLAVLPGRCAAGATGRPACVRSSRPTRGRLGEPREDAERRHQECERRAGR